MTFMCWSILFVRWNPRSMYSYNNVSDTLRAWELNKPKIYLSKATLGQKEVKNGKFHSFEITAPYYKTDIIIIC